MKNQKQYPLKIWLLGSLTLLTAIICFIELKKIYWGGLDRAIYFIPYSIFLFLLFLFLILLSFLLILAQSLFQKDFPKKILKSRLLTTSIFILLGIFPSYFFQFSQWGNVITSAFLRIILLLCVFFLMTYLINGKKIFSFNLSFFFPALIFSTASLLLGSRLKLIVNYPFSLSWSEGNRIWDYSLLFWKNHYLIAENSTAAAFLDLGRQSLWGLAFLCKNLTIAGMRAWNAILYFLPPLLLGFILFRNKKISFPVLILLGLWTYNFLSEGPIYAPLIICAIMVLLAGETKSYLLTLLLVICAAFYANLTRFTWILAPIVWSFLLIYFREKKSSPIQRNLKSFGAAVAGLVGGIILPNFIPIPTSSIILETNTSTDIFSSIKTIFQNQDLLWYRLFPSKTFPMGILPALFLISIPIFIAFIIYIKEKNFQLEKAEKFYLIAALCGFLLMGCVVSVKIGGGSNLHNMDMFLLTILLILHIFWKNGLAEWFMAEIQKKCWVSGLMLFLLLYPSMRFITNVRSLSLPSSETVQTSLSEIQTAIDDLHGQGEILFIDQRQLLTFGNIDHVKLIGEYEKKLLMN